MLLPIGVKVLPFRMVIINNNLRLFAHALKGDQGLGIHQDDGINRFSGQGFKVNIGKLGAVLVQVTFAISINIMRQQWKGIRPEQPGAQLGRQGIHISLFVS